MLGLMLPTWFLSMWISNTATASMMIPIANSVANQMGSVKKGTSARWAASKKVRQPDEQRLEKVRQPAKRKKRYTNRMGCVKNSTLTRSAASEKVRQPDGQRQKGYVSQMASVRKSTSTRLTSSEMLYLSDHMGKYRRYVNQMGSVSNGT